jgi:P-type Cu+ transporter
MQPLPQGGFPSLTVLATGPQHQTEIDPVCGMAVDPATALSHEGYGRTWYFCHPGCQDRFTHPEQHSSSLLASASGYVCSMCPEVHAASPGACPKCGMALDPADPSAGESAAEQALQLLQRRWVWCAIATAPVFLLAMGPMVGLPIDLWIGPSTSLLIQAVLGSAVTWFGGWPYWVVAWDSFRTRQWNMFSLLLVGVMAAWLLSGLTVLVPGFADALSPQSVSATSQRSQVHGSMMGHDDRPLHGLPVYFESAAAITTLMLFGQWLEQRARQSTGEALRQLLDLSPRVAHVLRQGLFVDLPVGSIRQHDTLQIRPGEQIPLDGTVLEGQSSVDESLMTGESIPVPKSAGSSVVGGTLNHTGSLQIRVDQTLQAGLLARLVQLVAEAQRSRAPSQRLADQLAAWFVPAVFGLAIAALVGGLWWGPAPAWAFALGNALAVLVMACPCALGLATPLAITVAVGRGARLGILFRDAAALERLERCRIMLFDKTGTLTVGQPAVSRYNTGDSTAPFDLLKFAGSLEQASEHPWARAIVREAERAGIPLTTAHNIDVVPGHGLSGWVDGHRVQVGRPDWVLRQQPTTSDDRWGPIQVLVAVDDRILGGLEFVDPVRPEAKSVMSELHRLSVRTEMLTGDRQEVANRIAEQVGIDEVHAQLTPEQKLLFVQQRQESQQHPVAMVGDGLNDAPALAQADVGIALGTGTDLARQSASVTLLSGDLRGVLRGYKLSRATTRIIRDNLWLAMVYNGLGLPLAAGLLYPLTGWRLDPMVAAAAMSLSSVSVILNSQRLRRIPLD